MVACSFQCSLGAPAFGDLACHSSVHASCRVVDSHQSLQELVDENYAGVPSQGFSVSLCTKEWLNDCIHVSVPMNEWCGWVPFPVNTPLSFPILLVCAGEESGPPVAKCAVHSIAAAF